MAHSAKSTQRVVFLVPHKIERDHYYPYSIGSILAYTLKMVPGLKERAEHHFIDSVEDIDRLHDPEGINFLLCSNYIWTIDLNFKLSRYAKSAYPDITTIHGGPSSPAHVKLCEEFLRENPHIDYVVRGEGEEALADMVRDMVFGCGHPENTPEISYLKNGQYIHNENRMTRTDLSTYPSPYGEGIFDSIPPGKSECLSIETNRRCPYSCSYCSWDFSSQKHMVFFDIERVRKDFEWAAERRINSVYVTDSNFGMFPRDEKIGRIICETKKKYGYPQSLIINYAKNNKERLARILSRFSRAGYYYTSAIAIQTRDEATLKAVNRQNMKQEHYDELADFFYKRRLPLAVHLMLGLPGATVDSFKNDLRYYFDENMMVEMFRTMVLPNSQISLPEYQKEYALETDECGAVTATSTMSADELRLMHNLAVVFHGVRGLGILRYPVLWLQYDKGIDCIDLLHKLTKSMLQPNEYRHLSEMVDQNHTEPYFLYWGTHHAMREKHRVNGTWQELFDEFVDWIARSCKIVIHRDVFSTLHLTNALLMPNAMLRYPFRISLPHDITAWYRDNRMGCGKPLHLYGPGELTVRDQWNLSSTETENAKVTHRHIQWELTSELFTARKEIRKNACTAQRPDAVNRPENSAHISP